MRFIIVYVEGKPNPFVFCTKSIEAFWPLFEHDVYAEKRAATIPDINPAIAVATNTSAY
jgi:hypothetical protein